MNKQRWLGGHQTWALAVESHVSMPNLLKHDLICQGHQKYGKKNTIESSLIVINHKPAVTDIWLNENIEGQFDLDLISQGRYKCGK